jgi:hypothetical protein
MYNNSYPATPMSIHEKNQFINYDRIESNLKVVRKHITRPLTLAEKIVYGILFMNAIFSRHPLCMVIGKILKVLNDK